MIAGWFAATLPVVVGALGLEAVFGYPPGLFRAIGHPVTWMGRLIGLLERSLNRQSWSFGRRRACGVLAVAVLIAATGSCCLLVLGFAPVSWPGFGLLCLVGASLPAQRSLDSHVQAVADGLDRGGLERGRQAVSLIVGRDPQTLDASGVARAAIESLAENLADGIVAPAFWMAIGGLTGGALYKAVNTADSMVGHHSDRFEAFGWAAARLDDCVNLPASRLSAVLLLAASSLTGGNTGGAWRAIVRDARRHRSPNAGWPEAAMAGALDIAIGGPRTYGRERVEAAVIGDGRFEVTAGDIRRALRLYRTACVLQGATLVCLLIGVRAWG